MADQEKRTLLQRLDGRFDMGQVLRVAGWGISAAAALAIAVFASRSEIGQQRAAIAMNPAQSEATRLATAQALTRADEAEREVHRLAETVQSLGADRDKLLNRVASLERSLEDLTGSIALTQPARKPPIAEQLLAPENGPDSPTQPDSATNTGRAPPRIDAPLSLAPDPNREPGSAPMSRGIPIPRADPRRSGAAASPAPVPSLLSPSPSLTGEPPASDPASLPTRETVTAAASSTSIGHDSGGQRHGIELGSATSIEGLRALWKKIRQGEASSLLADLTPVVSIRDAAQPGSVELRLVAGPLPNALAASRLCAALSAAGATCRATRFEGQSLAAR